MRKVASADDRSIFYRAFAKIVTQFVSKINRRQITKNEKSKDYCKADLKQRVLFFITIFRHSSLPTASLFGESDFFNLSPDREPVHRLHSW